jgi:hypothetical protein
MPTITLDEWKTAIQAISAFKQSAALKDVTEAFDVYAQRQTSSSLDRLARTFEVWRTTGPLAERTSLTTSGADLQTTITNAVNTNQVINVKASNVGQSKLYDLITPLRADMPGVFGALPPAQCLPPLTPTEIAKINEAFRRAKRAVELARDTMIKIAPKTALTMPLAESEALYVEYFGAYDQARARAVLSNYQDIIGSFDTKVMLYDIRNTPFGVDCYAACEIGRVTRPKLTVTGAGAGNVGAPQRVTSRVTMVMGRCFFSESIPKKPAAGRFNGSAAFDKTTDATAGTFVHELAHGAFHAVDAPKVDGSNNWELQPDLIAGDDYGASPDNDEQSSTPELDRRLAVKDPSIAIRNADNYGQFARQCMVLAGAE